jgi:glucosyl-3-phosphoglycerate synthase
MMLLRTRRSGQLVERHGLEAGVDGRVQEWLAQRTSLGSSWDRHDLLRARGGSRVDVVLPARDEADTVGAIVRAIRRELVEDVPLVSEVVVVDSGSVDDTAAVAVGAGARVVRQSSVLPELGDVPGKGEALWKALFATHGDVLVFVDADLREFDPQFVVGLLGPLLTDPAVGFVKAVYDRPLSTTDRVLPAGGGRVTELVARPLLNVHWPLLAGFVQPLAGEYAARRALLEQVPFASGYGVEIGLLIDLLELAGLGAMAQVDLGRRVHRNQDDAALGRMATQVLLTVLARLETHDRAVLPSAPGHVLTQFERVGQHYQPQETDVAVTDRPPMGSLPAYQRRPAWL